MGRAMQCQEAPAAALPRERGKGQHLGRTSCCNLLVSPCAAVQLISPKALACMDAHFWWGRYCCVPLRAKRACRPEGVRPVTRGCQAGDQGVPGRRNLIAPAARGTAPGRHPLAAMCCRADLFHRLNLGSAAKELRLGPGPWPTSANKGAGALAHIRKQPPLQYGCTHGSTAPRTRPATSPSVQPATSTASRWFDHRRLPAASSGSGGSRRCRMSMAMVSLWGMPWRRGRPAGGEGRAAGGGQRVGNASAPGQACWQSGSCGGGVGAGCGRRQGRSTVLCGAEGLGARP